MDGTDDDLFHLLGVFSRDYTTRLRKGLSRQIRMQMERSTMVDDGKYKRLRRLGDKLEQFHD